MVLFFFIFYFFISLSQRPINPTLQFGFKARLICSFSPLMEAKSKSEAMSMPMTKVYNEKTKRLRSQVAGLTYEVQVLTSNFDWIISSGLVLLDFGQSYPIMMENLFPWVRRKVFPRIMGRFSLRLLSGGSFRLRIGVY